MINTRYAGLNGMKELGLVTVPDAGKIFPQRVENVLIATTMILIIMDLRDHNHD